MNRGNEREGASYMLGALLVWLLFVIRVHRACAAADIHGFQSVVGRFDFHFVFELGM
ncbi:hypothetical protein [Bacillus sp. 1P06AnD]|uniref:hypothetical protein n=1 Tax=Bacillus sp. 1P06AnD TaxID=3132208 RepID=UPI00399F114A